MGIHAGVLGGAAAPASVALAADAFPLASAVDSYRILGMGGVKTVCAAGCDFASLTLADGLFARINTAGLYSDVTADIRGDLTAETGANRLAQWTDVLGGPWTLTIQPAGGAARTVSGSASGLIYLNGADRVTIDGLNSGGNSLLLRNTYTTGPSATIYFYNDASHNTVRNCTVEGASTTATSSAAYGVILFGTGATSGNDDNTITGNIIQGYSGAARLPTNLIYSSGASAAFANSGNTISDNTLKNFGQTSRSLRGYGINVASTGNENWTISGNTIYQEAARAATLWGIYFSAQGTNSISGNTIRDLMGTTVYGIQLGDARDTTVSRNRITLTTAGSTSAWYGIYFLGASGQPAAVTLVNNQVTISPTLASQPLYGIYDAGYSGNTLNVYHNSVYIGGTATGSATWAFQRTTTAADASTLKNNIIFNARTGGAVNHFAAGNQSAGGSFSSDYNIFAGTSTTAASFLDWGTIAAGTPVDFATWQTSSGGDSHSYADTATNIPPASLFTDAANGDLSIMTGSGFEAPPLPSNRGVAGLGVTDDYNGTLRSTTLPDLGACEFTVNRTGLAGPGTLAGGWGFYDTLGIAGDTVTAGADINVVDVTVASGATLDMAAYALNVAGTMTNNGSLRQTRPVAAGATVPFLTFGSAYYGAEVTAGGAALGSTTVTIQGNQACASAVGQPLKRCYEITPTTAASASIKFYFLGAEMQTGQTLGTLNVWHFNGATWDQIAKGATGGDNGCDASAKNCFVEGTGIAAYSPFQLKNSNPLAVPLETLVATATPAGAAIAWETTSELDVLGYHVYRAAAAAGAWTRLTGALLPSQAPGASGGYAYRWLDGAAQRGLPLSRGCGGAERRRDAAGRGGGADAGRVALAADDREIAENPMGALTGFASLSGLPRQFAQLFGVIL
ncbi:MAG: right-handed parallel beta-helix repeat-containing protein [Chloroflexi bacterium]|nr:right-handed parallel beta-helix repeat-containing protein [Chloroflexota bacterium]